MTRERRLRLWERKAEQVARSMYSYEFPDETTPPCGCIALDCRATGLPFSVRNPI
jgi:hypothetical protein